MKRIRSVGFCLALLLLLGSAQDAGDTKIISPDENFSFDSGLLVPSASALPGDAKVNTVAPAFGPGVNYNSIQEAIDNSEPGDIIYVQSGNYDEVVTVNKLGLSLKGVDSGDGMPVVSGDGVESTVTLSSDGCTLEGFVVINSGNLHAGICVNSSNNTIISNTMIMNQGYGILLYFSSNNQIFSNNVTRNGFSGIALHNSSNNNVTSNMVTFNNESGIEVWGSEYNTISENVASDNGRHGIFLLESDSNYLLNNIAGNNSLGGIEINDSEGTVVEGNVVIDVNMVASPEEGEKSTVVNFTIVVTNTGQVDFDKVTLSDRLPSGLDYVSDNRSGNMSDTEIQWTLPGPLAANESAIIELSAQISGTVLNGLTNEVVATGVTSKSVLVSDKASTVVSAIFDKASTVVSAIYNVDSKDSVSKAIELAQPGDVVEVESGTYRACIVLDKPITLKGVDTGNGPPVLMGDGVESTITLMADGCSIEGFVVTGSGNPHAGIEVVSNNNSISGNVIKGNEGYGIYVFESSGNSVTGNTVIENGFDGIYLEKSTDNDVSANVAISFNGKNGISLAGSSKNSVDGNVVEDNGLDGFRLEASLENSLSTNTIRRNVNGVHLLDSDDNSISGNRIFYSQQQGISLSDSDGNSIGKNLVKANSDHGLCLIRSDENGISGNAASNNNNDGIHIEVSVENDIVDNVVEGNLNGVRLIISHGNSVSSNRISNNLEQGIRLRGANQNTLTGNTVRGNVWYGFHLIRSNNNTLLDNDAEDNRRDGFLLEDSYGNEISFNTAYDDVNGLRLRNSDRNSISQNDIRYNNLNGVVLEGSYHNTLDKNVVERNMGHGLYLTTSSDNAIKGNYARYNGKNGLHLESSLRNDISASNIVEKSVYGLRLMDSHYNIISSNTVRDNNVQGIYLSRSDRNKIYLNTFTNAQNALSEGGANNRWFSPSQINYIYRGITFTGYRGNRWSDYTDNDLDGNGIGDSDYPIAGSLEVDSYPLTNRGVRINKTANISSGSRYADILFSINVTNTGEVYLNPVEVADVLPIGLEYVDHWPPYQVTVAGKTVTWANMGPIASSATRSVHLVARIDGSKYGPLTNAVNVTGTSPLGKKVSSQNATNVTVLRSGIEIDKVVSPKGGLPGTNLTFTIRVTNTEEAALNAVRVVDLLPSGLEHVSDNRSGIVAGDTIAWNLGSLPPESSTNIQLIASIKSGTESGNLTNIANVTGTPFAGDKVTDVASCEVRVGIQAAIDEASPGDTIIVPSGTYRENVVVNKTLTLTGVGDPVVDAGGSGSAITITADGCNVDGLEVRNGAEAGIKVTSNDNTISSNTATDSAYGIRLESSSGNTISGNTVRDNDDSGINLQDSSSNIINGNDIHMNGPTTPCVGLECCGIVLSGSDNNTISGNNASDNRGHGIHLASSGWNAISSNTISTNDDNGINLDGSGGNTVEDNAISYNGQHGICLDSSSSNTIYQNTFNNANNAWSDSSNTWHSPANMGNRWSDYTGWDCDGDGIGDVPYEIPGDGEEQDYYPLTDRTGPRTLTVCASGCNFTSIQAAIDTACPGYVIEVQSGIYYENVVVNKQLILRGVDTGGGKPVVDAQSTGSPITITADGCTLEGFEARNSGGYPNAGINVTSVGNTISNNTATGNAHSGIHLDSSSDSTITGNTVTDNFWGIGLEYSSGNTISGNTVTDNFCGIGLGFGFGSSNDNNIIMSNTVGDNNYDGIILVNSSGNMIEGNTVTGNTPNGISLYSSSDNTITGNIASDNYYGISLHYTDSNNNTINGNTATGNSEYGIYLDSSNDNTIYQNTFNNANNAWSDSSNTWNSPTEIEYEGNTTYVGNRWSDYTGRDCDGDGIGDVPNEIPGGSERDDYPLTDNFGTIITVCASGCDFTSIQVAIDAACPGDTIEVQSGTYNENVVVNKTLTLTGVGDPVVDAGGSGSAITITADGCTVEGFEARNSGGSAVDAGIKVLSNNSIISNNTATTNNGNGIRLRSSSNNTISENTANDNGEDGIDIGHSSDNNTIIGNTATGNGQYGIDFFDSDRNEIDGNTFSGNNYGGIRLDDSSDNTIYQNTFNNANNAWSDSSNTWNSPTNMGNRWSDYAGWDCDGDGIGDWPYEIPGGEEVEEEDEYPLTDRTGTRTLTVCASGCDFTSIQAAIDAACPGDTIEVQSGTYNENVVVDKQLTLTGVGDPVVDAGGSGSAITITADGCTVEGFVARNSGDSDGDSGIKITSDNSVVRKNNASGNNYFGIFLDTSNDNTISGNSASDNSKDGIALKESSDNTITSNTAADNSASGVYLDYNSNNNAFTGNTFTCNNLDGICLYVSSDNTIAGNTATGNGQNGILIFDGLSSNNTIYLNSFINNTQNGKSGSSGNHWNSTEPLAPYNNYTGNRWSDYSGSDANGDGIGDSPYPIPNGSEKDYYPIMTTTVGPGGSIQAAINAAGANSTILVESGTYYENVVLNKTLKLIGIDTGGGMPVVDGDSSGSAITVTADGCTVEGFVVQTMDFGMDSGIKITSNDNIISDNVATYNYMGILLYSSSGNNLTNNTATCNWFGIDLYDSCGNMITSNTVTGNSYGIYLTSSSDNNDISANTVTESGYGVGLISSSDNTIYQNTFNNNINSLSRDSSNHWNSTEPLNYTYNGSEYTNYTGNYWSDYSGNDSNGDGIGDTPYNISEGSDRDYYPMISGVNLTPMAAAALIPAIVVDLSGDLREVFASDSVKLTMNAINPGPENLTSVKIVALIPAGMSYLPGFANVEPDSVAESPNGTWTAAWENVTDLGAGESVEICFAARIDGDLFADLNTTATATGSLDEGENVSLSEDGSEYVGEIASGSDTWTVYVQNSVNANISVNKTADPLVAEPSDLVTFSINVTNTGKVELTNIIVTDFLPKGMSYVSASSPPLVDPIENPNGTVFLNWTFENLSVSESKLIALDARVDDDARGPLTNTAFVAATFREGIAVGFVKDFDNATVQLRALKVTKVADKDEVKRGEEIAYNITVCNVGSLPIMDLVLEDVFDHQVEVVSESFSRGSDGRWRIDLLENDSCVSILLIVKVPRQEFEFEMASRAEGEGFVNVADDYATTLDPFVIRNIVRAISANTTRQYSDSASVAVLGEPGTELETREHGSGSYESDEQVSVRTLNKSISMDKDVAATYAPTALGLYRNRTLNYSSRWTEEARAKNRISGTSLSESYRYATRIDRESRIFLDKNESVMEILSEFDGVGHIGFLKKDPGSSPGSVPLFESREDYTGSFRVLEKMDEYGSGIGSEKSASGEGLVLVDKRVGTSQKSYESGAGSYDSEELIRTETNYIAKDLSVASGGVETDLSGSFAVNSSMKWKEGMWSRVANTSFIGEEYSGASELDKETIARGLNDMETLANFTGRARYRAVLEDETEVDFDDQYEGTYSIQRRILLEGVPRYDRPHLSLAKDGEIVYPESNASPLASYSIFIENDGDKTLGPVIVRDLFPPGTVFVNSTLRPLELTDGGATWTLTHLAIGDKFKIGLLLNLTGYRDDEIVNQVEAEGGYNENWVRAENFSAVEIDWLRCCPSGDIVTVDKTGRIDRNETNVVSYTITVENVGEGAVAAVVTDTLPDGMVLKEVSPEFASVENGVVAWNLIDLGPEETRKISYRAEAVWSGRFVNRVRVDASLVDGSKRSSVFASSAVEVGEFEEEIQKPGWQPPEWGFNYTGYEADLTCEEICEITAS